MSRPTLNGSSENNKNILHYKIVWLIVHEDKCVILYRNNLRVRKNPPSAEKKAPSSTFSEHGAVPAVTDKSTTGLSFILKLRKQPSKVRFTPCKKYNFQ